MYDWLDKIIEEQAAYYGKSVSEFSDLMNDAAEYQKQIEQQDQN